MEILLIKLIEELFLNAQNMEHFRENKLIKYSVKSKINCNNFDVNERCLKFYFKIKQMLVNLQLKFITEECSWARKILIL